jgi:hypothetical protein
MKNVLVNALYQLQVWSKTFATWKAASCRSSARNPHSTGYTSNDLLTGETRAGVSQHAEMTDARIEREV